MEVAAAMAMATARWVAAAAVATTTTWDNGEQQHNNQHDNQYDNKTMTTTKMNVAAIVVVPSERLPQRGRTTPPAGGGGESNIHNNNICEGIDESTGAGGMFGSRPVYPIRVNHACMLTNIVVCPDSFVHTWEGEAQLILKIIVEVQGADLRPEEVRQT
jgi:hypothetical protein